MLQPAKTTTSSALLTGDYLITKVVLNAGGAAGSVILDDSTDGNGTQKVKLLESVVNSSKVLDLGDQGVRFKTGVYATLTGTGAQVWVYYR